MQDLAREHGVSPATIHSWCSKFGGMDVSEAERLRELEGEDRKLKVMVAELSLDRRGSKIRSLKRVISPAAKREAVECLRAGFSGTKGEATAGPWTSSTTC